MSASPALLARGVTKRFGATTALDGVDLEIHPGRVRALIGMNGSGKSTFVKTLSGLHTLDGGTVDVAGTPLGGDGATLSFVHQDLGLVPTMSVLENLALGRRLATRHGRVDWASERERARRALAPFNLQHVVDTSVERLTKAEATVVAVARALERCDEGCKVLVLDEPTSTLPASQTEQLLDVMRGCASRGIAVLFITHRLREVLAVSDDVTVLRNGRVSWDGAAAGTGVEQLAQAMVGEAAATLTPAGEVTRSGPAAARRADSRVALRAEGLAGDVVAGIDLSVRRGEIVGVFGLLGSGVEELGTLLSGRQHAEAGVLEVDGQPLRDEDVGRIGFVPADRPARGVLTGLTARENATISHAARYVAGGRLRRSGERRAIAEWFAEMMVHPSDPEATMNALSGGNQQKVLLIRALAVHPVALVAEEPTQGVDIHAKAQILGRIAAHASRGVAAVLLSGEPEEIGAVCDRVVVLRGGRIAAEFSRPFSIGDVVAAMH